MDTKKNELIGQYKNGGRGWMPTGEPVKVKTHDFLDRQGSAKAIPYGIYDIAANTGWAKVGTDHGVKVTDAEIDTLPMHRHRFHGDWNYTLHPQPHAPRS
ncbi:hypothetical protein RKD37_001053 [Streptomyces ambofaciens]